jgi:hypothetical protein
VRYNTEDFFATLARLSAAPPRRRRITKTQRRRLLRLPRGQRLRVKGSYTTRWSFSCRRRSPHQYMRKLRSAREDIFGARAEARRAANKTATATSMPTVGPDESQHARGSNPAKVSENERAIVTAGLASEGFGSHRLPRPLALPALRARRPLVRFGLRGSQYASRSL